MKYWTRIIVTSIALLSLCACEDVEPDDETPYNKYKMTFVNSSSDEITICWNFHFSQEDGVFEIADSYDYNCLLKPGESYVLLKECFAPFVKSPFNSLFYNQYTEDKEVYFICKSEDKEWVKRWYLCDRFDDGNFFNASAWDASFHRKYNNQAQIIDEYVWTFSFSGF